MQATTMGGAKLEKRYSPSFRDDAPSAASAAAAAAGNAGRKQSASKRKRDDTLRLVQTLCTHWPTRVWSTDHAVNTHTQTHILHSLVVSRRRPSAGEYHTDRPQNLSYIYIYISRLPNDNLFIKSTRFRFRCANNLTVYVSVRKHNISYLICICVSICVCSM